MSWQTIFFSSLLMNGQGELSIFVGHVQISPFTVCVDVMGLNEHLDKKLCGLFRQVLRVLLRFYWI